MRAFINIIRAREMLVVQCFASWIRGREKLDINSNNKPQLPLGFAYFAPRRFERVFRSKFAPACRNY